MTRQVSFNQVWDLQEKTFHLKLMQVKMEALLTNDYLFLVFNWDEIDIVIDSALISDLL